MYCPSCGIDSVEGLKYCKRCGVNLTGPPVPLNQKNLPIALIITVLFFIACVFIAGLAMPFLITKELPKLGFSQGDMMALFVLESGLTLAVVAMLVRLLFRLVAASPPNSPARAVDLRSSDSPTNQLSPPPEHFVSVTENTTRSFEPRTYDNVTPRNNPLES